MHFAMHFAHFFRLQKIKVPQVQMAVRRLLSCGRPDLPDLAALALLAMPGA